jgi:hypothetical protein
MITEPLSQFAPHPKRAPSGPTFSSKPCRFSIECLHAMHRPTTKSVVKRRPSWFNVALPCEGAAQFRQCVSFRKVMLDAKVLLTTRVPVVFYEGKL